LNYESNNSNPKLEKDDSFIISSNPKPQYKNSYYISLRFNKNFNFINKQFTNEAALTFLYSSSLSKYTHMMIALGYKFNYGFKQQNILFNLFNKKLIIIWYLIIINYLLF
jgi:hypothetical protein